VYICRKVGIPRAEPKIVETRQFKYFNSSAFQYDLKMAFQRHYNLYNYAYPNYAWEVWKTIFLDIANIHAPLLLKVILPTCNARLYERIPFEYVFSFSREFRVDKQSLVTQ
jgi:hypothetical protein